MPCKSLNQSSRRVRITAGRHLPLDPDTGCASVCAGEGNAGWSFVRLWQRPKIRSLEEQKVKGKNTHSRWRKSKSRKTGWPLSSTHAIRRLSQRSRCEHGRAIQVPRSAKAWNVLPLREMRSASPFSMNASPRNASTFNSSVAFAVMWRWNARTAIEDLLTASDTT
jgi:hypothetical protein